jgi:branched-chain amino acid transport system permease protein
MPKQERIPGLIAILLLSLGLLIPYLIGLGLGEAQAGQTGWQSLHSRAQSIFCQEGSNPTGNAYMFATGITLLITLVAHAQENRLGVWGAALRRHGFEIFIVLLLVSLPFISAWQTDSSVCERGKAYFWQSIFIDVFIMAILAISYNLLFGFTGIISFGHAAFFGLGAYLVGIFIKLLVWPWWVAILVTLLVGVVIALVNGVVGLRIRGLYFALFTLAFAEIIYLLAGNRLLVKITGAEDGFTFSVPDFLNNTTNRLFFYYLTAILLILAYLIVRRLMKSPTGQVFYAMRDNEERTQMLGYNTFVYKLIALIVSGVMATGAGVLRGIAAKGASPNVLGVGFTFDPLLSTIIGGIGTFPGPVIGASFIHLLEQSLRNTVLTIGSLEINIGERWALILGIIFIIVVMAFPRGIVGTVQVAYLRWKARRKDASEVR